MIRREDLLAYLGRDWRAVRDQKDASMAEHIRALGVAASLRQDAALWAEMLRTRPEGPTPAEREEDLRAHARLAALLGSVPRARLPR